MNILMNNDEHFDEQWTFLWTIMNILMDNEYFNEQ